MEKELKKDMVCTMKLPILGFSYEIGFFSLGRYCGLNLESHTY